MRFAILLLMQFIAITCTAVEAALTAAAIATASEQATETGADTGERWWSPSMQPWPLLPCLQSPGEPFNWDWVAEVSFCYIAPVMDMTSIDARSGAGRGFSDMYLDAHGKFIPDKSTDGCRCRNTGNRRKLEHLAAHYGRLSLAQSLEPAINLARNGITVSEALEQAAKPRVDTFM
ncbi:MAG: gamma-glutamyltransferase [Gammaproteobacteria bacterium]